MSRRLFLHVGSPKTGTTYLQEVLWNNKHELARQGLHLPLRGVGEHFNLTLHLRGRVSDIDGPAVHQVMDRLRADLDRHRARGRGDVLISHELLAPVEPDQIAKFLAMFEGYEVHVVITARDLQRQIPAEWQQSVKTRYQGTYGDFLRRVQTRRVKHFWAVQDIADVAARWGDSGPPDRVHVVTVPPSGTAPTVLLERFCSVIGIDPTRLDPTVLRGNPSLGYPQAELVRRVNAALGERLPHPRTGYSRVVKGWFAEQLLAAQAGPKLPLPAPVATWCHAESERIVERVRSAGYDVVGDLADLVPAPVAGPDVLVEPSDAAVAEAAVEALCEVLVQRLRDMKARDRWRERSPDSRFVDLVRSAARRIRRP
jgi:hypothetical protein